MMHKLWWLYKDFARFAVIGCGALLVLTLIVYGVFELFLLINWWIVLFFAAILTALVGIGEL